MWIPCKITNGNRRRSNIIRARLSTSSATPGNGATIYRAIIQQIAAMLQRYYYLFFGLLGVFFIGLAFVL